MIKVKYAIYIRYFCISHVSANSAPLDRVFSPAGKLYRLIAQDYHFVIFSYII